MPLWNRNGHLLYINGKLCNNETCPCGCPTDGCVNCPNILTLDISGSTCAGVNADNITLTRTACVWGGGHPTGTACAPANALNFVVECNSTTGKWRLKANAAPQPTAAYISSEWNGNEGCPVKSGGSVSGTLTKTGGSSACCGTSMSFTLSA